MRAGDRAHQGGKRLRAVGHDLIAARNRVVRDDAARQRRRRRAGVDDLGNVRRADVQPRRVPGQGIRKQGAHQGRGFKRRNDRPIGSGKAGQVGGHRVIRGKVEKVDVDRQLRMLLREILQRRLRSRLAGRGAVVRRQFERQARRGQVDCDHIHVRRMRDQRMSDLLKHIASEEGEDQTRPDIAIVFSSDPQADSKVSVVMVELKKQGLPLAKNEEVISQLKQRARKLLTYVVNTTK